MDNLLGLCAPKQLTPWQSFLESPLIFVTERLYSRRAPTRRPTSPANPVRTVCISDTHNLQPELPDGDVLLHAGDLTDRGTFDELQTQFDWLDKQPHRFRVVIAGNDRPA